VAWYGRASLLPHLRQLVARGAIDVKVRWGDPVAYDEFSDRKAVARRLEDDVRAMTVAALRGRPAARAISCSPDYATLHPGYGNSFSAQNPI
jgi:lyso-ornithine lipid O-acyltransferase